MKNRRNGGIEGVKVRMLESNDQTATSSSQSDS